jgi:hypothetical protein
MRVPVARAIRVEKRRCGVRGQETHLPKQVGTRSWSEAQSNMKNLEKRLKDFAEGKVVPKGMTVEAAVQEWYEFRDQNEFDNTKAKLMGGKLVEWCEKNNILFLSALASWQMRVRCCLNFYHFVNLPAQANHKHTFRKKQAS